MGSGVLQETVSRCVHKWNFKLNQYRYKKQKQTKKQKQPKTHKQDPETLEKSWGLGSFFHICEGTISTKYT